MTPSHQTGDLFPALEAAKFLVDADIEHYVTSEGMIAKEHFDNDCLQGCSYDIRIGDRGVIGGSGHETDLSAGQTLELNPGEYAGIISLEKVTLPRNVFARLGAKRKFSYDGLILLSGHTVDPGYSGHLVFGVYNASSRKRFLRRGQKIAAAVFMLLGKQPQRFGPADPYLSKGRFPPDFMSAIDQLEVLPYAELSERVGELNKLRDDVAKLNDRMSDVFSPISMLKTSVERLREDIESNAQQIAMTSKDVDKVARSVEALGERYRDANLRIDAYEKDLSTQKVTSKILLWAVGAIWTLIVIGLTLVLKKAFDSQ